MKNGLSKLLGLRRNKAVRVTLRFDDIMEFAIALLSVSPAELSALGWTFADRKRFLEQFLASGRAAQDVDPEHLRQMPIEIAVLSRDIDCLQRFALRELPKAASSAAMIDRVLLALDHATRIQHASKQRKYDHA